MNNETNAEFVKTIREYIADFIYAEEHSVAMQNEPRVLERDLLEACDRIEQICKPKTKAAQVIKDILEKAKETHKKWLDYFQIALDAESEVKITAGSIQHQKKCIERYGRALDALGSLQVGIEQQQDCIREMVKTLKEQGYHKIDCATQAAAVADEFAAMGCTCGLITVIGKAEELLK